MLTVVNHDHFFCPDGTNSPHEAYPGSDAEERNECMRFDAVETKDGQFLVWDAWAGVYIKKCADWEEACRLAKFYATW